METRQLGQTNLHITPLGLGTWAIGGGGYAFGWGSQIDADSLHTIHRALDLGINWIDTAPVYGLGHAEKLIGQVLQSRSDRPLVFTKCSIVWDERGRITRTMREASIRQEVEESLRRLKIEALDLYQVHWPDPESEIEEGWRTVAALQQEGKVRHIGVSNFTVEHMQRAQRIAPIETLQPPYSLVRPGIEEEVLPFCQEHRIGVMVYSPMMSGLLSGTMTPERIRDLPEDDWRKKSPDFQEPKLSHALRVVEACRSIGQRYGRSPREVAVAWALRHPAVAGAIIGGRRPDQIEEITGAGRFTLNDEDVSELTGVVRQPVYNS